MERRRRKKIENERNPIEVSYESLGMSIKNQGKKKKEKYFLLLLVGHLGFASRVGSFLSFSFLPLTVDSRLGWLTESGVRWHNRRSHWFPRPVPHPPVLNSSLIGGSTGWFFFSSSSPISSPVPLVYTEHLLGETNRGSLCQFVGVSRNSSARRAKLNMITHQEKDYKEREIFFSL